MSSRMGGLIRGMGLAAGLVALVAGAAMAQDGALRVSGTGTVAAAPDAAELRLSVLTVAPEAQAAMEALTVRLAAVIAALRTAGVAETDLQSTDLSLQPIYAPRNGRNDMQPPQIDGYRARTGLTVQVRALDALGGLVDAALRAGANGFEGVTFTHSTPGPLMRLARERAVADAVDRAETYASAAGLILGDIVELRQGGGGGFPGPVAEMRMAADSLVLAPGELSFSDTVTIVFTVSPIPG